ncbi:MAG: DUF1844 domain-containing protein [Phycisphaeraceae bacterium]|nr:DUF1844 domain-containing protein [Phycisphaeraceae bacterium]
MSQNPGEPKIVIDSDWKAQAQAERAKLAEQEKKSAAAKPAPAGDGDAQMEGLPPADFQTLLGSMITQALMYMGGFPDPETGRAMVSLEHAKFHIDLLGVLEEKTKGNLTEEEASDLSRALTELRMRFVEISKAVAAAIERGAVRSGAAPGGPAGPRVGPATGPSLGL